MEDSYTDKVFAFAPGAGMSLAADAIDEEAGTIKGVSIATAGVEAIGHGEYDDESGELLREFWTDATTLEDMLSACLAIGEPLKAKLEHGTGLVETVGTFDNFRIDGEHLRADFTAFKTASQVRHLFELAKRISRQFGVSVTAQLRKAASGAVDLMRCDQILSADFVDEPAINAALFSRKNELDKKPHVSKKPIQMTDDEFKSAMAEALKPVTDRLSKLEEGMTPDDSKLAEETKAKEEMSSKLTAAESELTKINGELSELKTKITEATALGIKVGPKGEQNGGEPAVSFESELAKVVKSGTPKHLAVATLLSSNRALVEAEAKKQNKHIWQL